MPTATVTGGAAGAAACGVGSCCGSMADLGTEGWRRGRRREGPPRSSDAEEACDERSAPQDVTSSGSEAEGSICSQRSDLSRPRDLLATPPEEGTPGTTPGGK